MGPSMAHSSPRPTERLLAAAVMLRSVVLLAVLPSSVGQFDFGLNVGNEACSMAVYEQRVVSARRAPLR